MCAASQKAVVWACTEEIAGGHLTGNQLHCSYRSNLNPDECIEASFTLQPRRKTESLLQPMRGERKREERDGRRRAQYIDIYNKCGWR